MARRKIQAGTTSLMLPVFVQDTTSTTGGGLAITHASSGLVFEWRREGDSAWTAPTAVAGTLGTYTSAGIVADGALTGAIEIGIPNAAIAAGKSWAQVRLRGVTNMLPVLLEFELDAVNYQDSVRFGMTALPNVASGSAGAVVTSGTGTSQLSVASGLVTVGTINTDVISEASVAAAAANKIADATLTRHVNNVEVSAAEHTLCTAILSLLEFATSGTTLTIKRSDGTTTHYVKTLTLDAGSVPVVGVN